MVVIIAAGIHPPYRKLLLAPNSYRPRAPAEAILRLASGKVISGTTLCVVTCAFLYLLHSVDDKFSILLIVVTVSLALESSYDFLH